MNIQRLLQYKEKNLVKYQLHPRHDLYIWNYTDLVQAKGPWDDITTRTRALVTDSNGTIHAHSFRKFHNIEQNLHTPTNDFQIYEKLDGSLIIVFWYKDEWIIASRGSFTSEQAKFATHLIHHQYTTDYLNRDVTYCFEIIYPENRIVVDYGSECRKLVFIGAFFKDGTEANFHEHAMLASRCTFPIVKTYAYDDYTSIKKLNWANSEGFVVRFSNGERVKIKFQNYLDLHRVVSNLTTQKVWEMFCNAKASSQTFADYIATSVHIPDEFLTWVTSVWDTLENDFSSLVTRIKSEYANIINDTSVTTRQAFAHKAKQHPHNKLLFMLYDGRDITKHVCDMIKPVTNAQDAPFMGKAASDPENTSTPAKLIILSGISASGKSTWARKYVRSTPNTVRVNRDTMRMQLFGYSEEDLSDYHNTLTYTANEKLVTICEENLISTLLKHGKDVIIDNTNLKKPYIQRYTKTFKHHPIIFKVFDVDMQEAIERDSMRPPGATVGAKTIEKQYMNFQSLQKEYAFKDIEPTTPPAPPHIPQDPTLPHGYIFDVDGTLANNLHRSPYDWSKVHLDTVIEPVKQTLLAHYNQGYRIIICTGRDGTCSQATQDWLAHHNIPYHEFHSRPPHDTTPDYKVKEKMWRDIVQHTYVVAMYDDRNSVVKHARACGFAVFQVNDGDF